MPRPDDPAAHYSGDTVVALPPDACLAARPAGLGQGPRGLPDGLEIVAQGLESRQDAAHRVPQLLVVHPWVLPVRLQVQRDAAAHQVWVPMRPALQPRVSRALAMTPELQTEQFRASQQLAQRRLGALLQDERLSAPLKAMEQ